MTPDEAREAVQRARSVFEEADAEAQRARAQFHALLADIQNGRLLRQSELVDLAGYEREHLRRIKHAAEDADSAGTVSDKE